MSENKFVLLHYQTRAFKTIIPCKEPKIPDVDQIREAFEKRVEKDALLQLQLRQCWPYIGFSFKIRDPDIGDKLRDVEEEDVLTNGQSVFVELVYPLGMDSPVPNSFVSLNETQTTSDCTKCSEDNVSNCGTESSKNANRKRQKRESKSDNFMSHFLLRRASQLDAVSSDGNNDATQTIKKNKEIPYPFPFPADDELPGPLRQKLGDDEPLRPNLRNRLVRIITSIVLSFKSNPSRKDYTSISLQAMQRWPKLAAGRGNPVVEFQKTMSKRIRYVRQRDRVGSATVSLVKRQLTSPLAERTETASNAGSVNEDQYRQDIEEYCSSILDKIEEQVLQ